MTQTNTGLAAIAGEEDIPMSMDRAHNINGALISIGLVREGFTSMDKAMDCAAYLEDVSLLDMLEAKAFVEAENQSKTGPGPHSITMVCDDRLIAAIYVMIHYRIGDIAAMCGDKMVALNRTPTFAGGTRQ